MRECNLHGDTIRGWGDLYDHLSKELDFPAWFGRNLDALYDCLTDLDASQITIYRWSALSETLGAKANVFRRVLTDAGLENPGLTVSFLDEESDEI